MEPKVIQVVEILTKAYQQSPEDAKIAVDRALTADNSWRFQDDRADELAMWIYFQPDFWRYFTDEG